MKLHLQYLTIIILFVIGASVVDAQQITSRRNIFGGEDVYINDKPVYSTRRNVFGGRDWLLPNHSYPPRQPQYWIHSPIGRGQLLGNDLLNLLR